MKKWMMIIVGLMILLIDQKMYGEILSTLDGYQRISPYEIIQDSGKLILSNSPEAVYKKGILYEEQLSGKGRLVYHHVNEMHSKNKRLVILVRNLTDEEQMLRIDKEGITSSKYDYLTAGFEVLQRYYRTQVSRIYFIEPNEQMVLYDSKNTIWKPKTVLSGMIDIWTSDEVRITFCVLDTNEAYSKVNHLPVLKRDFAPRGTFNLLAKHQIAWIPDAEKCYFLIENEKKSWQKGKDALTGKETVNHGNYGIIYKIKVVSDMDAQVFVCPRGGVFEGMICWQDGQGYVIKRKHRFKRYKESIAIGDIKKGETRVLEYILPNGSAAPVMIGFSRK